MVELLTFFYHSDGMEHINYLMTTMFSSLMKESNIPDIMKTEKVIHNVYCHEADLKYLKENYSPLAGSRGLEVFYYPIINNRNNLFIGIYDQFKKAVTNDSKVIISAADTVWAGGLSAAVKRVKKGEAIFTPSLRIKTSGYAAVNEFLKTEHSNSDFSRLFLEEVPHKLLELAKENKWDYVNLEKAPDGWICYHKEPIPIVYWPSEDIVKTLDIPMKTIEILDHWFTQLLYDSNRALWSVANDEVFVGEFTDDLKYNTMFDNRYMNPAAGFFLHLPIHHRIG
jgi:hypothetical protein